MVNDTDGGSTGWNTYSDVITVTNNLPSLVNYALSDDEVLRTSTIVIGANTTDIEDTESSHTVTVEYRAPSGDWSSSALSTPWYNSATSRWESNFTPPSSLELGEYDLRIKVTDIDSGSTGWNTYSDVITVNNNLPSLVNYALSADEVLRTSTIISASTQPTSRIPRACIR